jgi:hypothetical protein
MLGPGDRSGLQAVIDVDRRQRPPRPAVAVRRQEMQQDVGIQAAAVADDEMKQGSFDTTARLKTQGKQQRGFDLIHL